MKRKAKTSDTLETNEQDVVYLPESTLREIDKTIKHTKLYSDREEFIEAAIQNFISDANQENKTYHDREEFIEAAIQNFISIASKQKSK
ncbi:MAG: ribbon-helix-helix domain-containing protein [Candidatus Bathyarchaeia archaeon]|jgi:metal-responsive CopG/Arc/MetJ family transcriptional regulator